MNTSLRIRLLYSLVIAFILFFIGVIGYYWLEDFSWSEAIYMTIITLSTVGFGEVRPLTPEGRIFTAIIIVMGVITITVLFGTLTEYIIAGELTGSIKKRHLMKTIQNLKNHYIVCGFGRVGEQVAAELVNLGVPCVVVDQQKVAIEKCELRQLNYIEGDATENETLLQAGIEQARGLVAALSSDADNVFAVLSARSLNSELTIVGRSTGEESKEKLRMAGADRVVSPYQMAGYRIVNQLTRPHVTDFLDTAMRSKGLDLWLDEIRVSPHSPLVSQSMGDAEIRSKTGANILSILRGDDNDHLDWSPELRLQPDDMLIVVGKPEELKTLADLAEDDRFK
ncbi:MAG: potassium channel protein [Anaerolineales bacterium]|nr:potassium channel protein [Chloroflexota bacterium]MBL6981675.1 potassium channel protein [Anaerolineales bacterium]